VAERRSHHRSRHQAERWFTTPPNTSSQSDQVRNVSAPSLMAFLPEPSTATGTAVIICSGGALHVLAIGHEGYDVARWWAARGVAAFVLKYRIIPTPELDEAFEQHMSALMADPHQLDGLTRIHRPHVLADGRQTLALVRQHASEWGIAADRIGMLGFSARGYVTESVTTDPGDFPPPAFAAVIYGALFRRTA